MTLPPASRRGRRAAYRHCEQITRQQAKNFAYGIALLPGDKRRALSAVYAFARRIDDIGDGTMPAADKIDALERARAELSLAGTATRASRRPGARRACATPRAGSRSRSARSASSSTAARPTCAAPATPRSTSWSTTAGAWPGRSAGCRSACSAASDPAAAEPLADSLGVALQLTNILRDIREDLGNGRVYLPAEDIERFGCTIAPGGPGRPAAC